MKTTHQKNRDSGIRFPQPDEPVSLRHQKPILVAGIGNIFMGDDGFGSEVARRLMAMEWPDRVRVVDFGICGIDLVYAMLDGCESVILIDAVPGDEPPGTLRVIEPDLDQLDPGSANATLLDAHSMHPLKVLQSVKGLGGNIDHVLIVGCQPKSLGGEEGHIGLSEPVAAAVDKAIELVGEIVHRGQNRQLRTCSEEAESDQHA